MASVCLKIWKKKGIEFFIKQNMIGSLRDLLLDGFPGCDPFDIIETMNDSTQYFILKKKKIVAIVSIVKKGGMNRIGKKYPNMIYNVATHTEYKRQGLMKCLFDKIEKDVFKRGEAVVNLEVYKDNKPAIQFYKKRGFKRFGNRIEVPRDKSSYMMRLKNFIDLEPNGVRTIDA
jgi:GNAT superfamily N-acetyltransferase